MISVKIFLFFYFKGNKNIQFRGGIFWLRLHKLRNGILDMTAISIIWKDLEICLYILRYLISELTTTYFLFCSFNNSTKMLLLPFFLNLIKVETLRNSNCLLLLINSQRNEIFPRCIYSFKQVKGNQI